MVKQRLAFLAAAFAVAGNSLAGGLLTNTNQNVVFLRNPARDAAIGIDGETLPATYRIYYRLPQGIYVTRVYRNSDAAAKGISEGDIITAINGVSVTTMEQLNRVKNQFTAGQTITLTIYHGGVSSDVEIILMDRANA